MNEEEKQRSAGIKARDVFFRGSLVCLLLAALFPLVSPEPFLKDILYICGALGLLVSAVVKVFRGDYGRKSQDVRK